MAGKRISRQTLLFDPPPVLEAAGAVGGKRELEGPLRDSFDLVTSDTRFGQKSWEKAETQMQQLALQAALDKASLRPENVDMAFGGDLLNQCISTSFGMRDAGIPFFGLYGACSTMAEGLTLAAMAVCGGFAGRAAAITSSHFASAERQYRFPLVYGGQRTTTSQWTVTGSGCALVTSGAPGPRITAATVGRVVDWGIRDANNMGAAMAPAAYDTIVRHLEDRGMRPGDFDAILTGDLGYVGRTIVEELFRRDGVSLEGVYNDCGTMIYDRERQDVQAGGSGCGCSAVVLCGHVYRQLLLGRCRRVLLCGSGALLSTVSTQQGESIPGICHAVSIELEGS